MAAKADKVCLAGADAAKTGVGGGGGTGGGKPAEGVELVAAPAAAAVAKDPATTMTAGSLKPETRSGRIAKSL